MFITFVCFSPLVHGIRCKNLSGSLLTRRFWQLSTVRAQLKSPQKGLFRFIFVIIKIINNMKNKNFFKITIRCQSAEKMQKAKEAVLYHLETLNPEFEANGSTLTVTVPPLDPKLFFPEEACSNKRRERRNKNDFFLSPKNFREARKMDGVGLPLASPDMLYKERTPKITLRGSENGGCAFSDEVAWTDDSAIVGATRTSAFPHSKQIKSCFAMGPPIVFESR